MATKNIIDIDVILGNPVKPKKDKMGPNELRARNEKVIIEGNLKEGLSITFFESGYGLIPLVGKQDMVLHIRDLVERPFMYDKEAQEYQKEGRINPEDYLGIDWEAYVYLQYLDRIQHRINDAHKRGKATNYDDEIDPRISTSAEEDFFETLLDSDEAEKKDRIFSIIKNRLTEKEWDAFYQHYGKGRTHKSIAEDEGIRQQGVLNRINRGKQKLEPVMGYILDIYLGNE